MSPSRAQSASERIRKRINAVINARLKTVRTVAKQNTGVFYHAWMGRVTELENLRDAINAEFKGK